MRYFHGSVVILACLAGSLAMAGCSRDVNPVRDVFVSVGAGATVPPAPDFVVNSRTAEHKEYIPVGIRQPPRKIPAKTPEQMQAVERNLDAVRANAEARGNAALREGASAGSN